MPVHLIDFKSDVLRCFTTFYSFHFICILSSFLSSLFFSFLLFFYLCYDELSVCPFCCGIQVTQIVFVFCMLFLGTDHNIEPRILLI